MGPFERRLRAAINPISTGLTSRWYGIGRRQAPPKAMPERGILPPFTTPRAFSGVSSPGHWVVPSGMRPGWDWLPEPGASPNLRAMPRWARVWYRLPFIDRFAYEWMWWHGGWSVWVPGDDPPPPDIGVREPRRPTPADRTGAAAVMPEDTSE